MNVLKYGKLEINPSKMSETMNVQMKKSTQTKIVTESFEDGEFLLPRIEAIHAGRTRNYNHYLAEKLRGDASIKSGVYSWMQPSMHPISVHHNPARKPEILAIWQLIHQKPLPYKPCQIH